MHGNFNNKDNYFFCLAEFEMSIILLFIVQYQHSAVLLPENLKCCSSDSKFIPSGEMLHGDRDL